MRSTKITRSRVAAAAVALSMAAAGAIGFAASSEAAVATYQVSPKTGPGGDNNAGGTSGQPASAAKVITINGTGNAFKTAAGTVKVATVTWATSAATCAQGSNSLSGFAVPTATQVVVTVPADTLALAGTSPNFTKKDYTVCVYDSTPTLLGTAKYTVYPTPTITAAVSPVKGPATGGNTIAIDGTGFTATSVVKVNGVAATQVKVASDGQSLTAKVPAGTASASAVQVTVTTEGGKNTVANAAHDDYTYSNAVAVSPATGDGTVGNVITVTGNGFSSFTANAGVYLKQSAWTVAQPGTACSAFQVISDTQLVCTLPVLNTDGPYSVFVVGDNTVLATASVISASATYTVADF